MNPLPAVRSDVVTVRQFLITLLGGEIYALDIRGVREIIEMRDLTEIPLMPPAIRGVINLRGAVVPVIDLLARFGKGVTVPGRRTCLVIVEPLAGSQVIGVLVDAVNEVIDLPADAIEPPPALGARLRADFISGLLRLGERFALILDLSQVLSIDELTDLAALAVEHH